MYCHPIKVQDRRFYLVSCTSGNSYSPENYTQLQITIQFVCMYTLSIYIVQISLCTLPPLIIETPQNVRGGRL